MVGLLEELYPYMFELEKEVIEVTSDESSDDEEEFFDALSEKDMRMGKIDWCQSGNCKIVKREIDCLCCCEVDALNNKFDEASVIAQNGPVIVLVPPAAPPSRRRRIDGVEGWPLLICW